MENYNQVDVELDFELFVDIRGAGVRSWEEHVEWNLEIGQHVAIGNLNVLNLRRIRLAFERLHTNELNLNRLNLDFRLLKDEVAVEWLIEAAIHGGNLAAEVEAGHFALVFRVRQQRIWSNAVVLRLKAATELGEDAAARDSAIELFAGFKWLSLVLSLHGHIGLVNDGEVDADIAVNQRVFRGRFKFDAEVQRVAAREDHSIFGDGDFLGHEVDSLFLGQGRATQIAADHTHSVHVSLKLDFHVVELDLLGRVFQRDGSFDVFRWLVHFGRTREIDNERRLGRSRCSLHHIRLINYQI